MHKDAQEFRNQITKPATIVSEEVAYLLGIPEHSVKILISKGLLKPLGKPTENGTKHFATRTIIELGQDIHWLERAIEAIRVYWLKKNTDRGNQGPGGLRGE